MRHFPKSWSVKPLEKVATLQRGFDLPVHKRIPNNIPIFAANGVVGFHNEAKVQAPGVVTGRSGTLGKVHYVESDYWPLNTSLWVKKFHGNDPKWIYRLLSWMKLERHTRGTGVPTLNRNLIHVVPVPLPPLEEQKRIAAILDKADAVRRKRKEAIALTEELARSTFLDMFGDPVTNPKGWETKLLKEVCARVTVGYVGSMASEYIENGIPWLRSLNINRNQIMLNNVKYVSKEFHHKLNKSSLLPGDVVSVRTGNAGVTAVIPDTLVEANCSDLIVMTCGRSVLPKFLAETLNMLLGDRGGGSGLTGAIQKHFNITRAKTLSIPTPPIEKQKKWIDIAYKIELTHSNTIKLEEKLDNLFNSLLQKAFRGEL